MILLKKLKMKFKVCGLFDKENIFNVATVKS
jgi:hypothetical protein